MVAVIDLFRKEPSQTNCGITAKTVVRFFNLESTYSLVTRQSLLSGLPRLRINV